MVLKKRGKKPKLSLRRVIGKTIRTMRRKSRTKRRSVSRLRGAFSRRPPRQIVVQQPYYPPPPPPPRQLPPQAVKVELAMPKEEPLEVKTGITIGSGTASYAPAAGTIGKAWLETSKAGISDSYPLITAFEGGPVLAGTTISWNPAEQQLVYNLYEPPMSEQEIKLLRKLENKIEEKLDIDFSASGIGSQEDYLRKGFYKMADLFGIKLTKEQKLKFEYYLFRDFIGLNEIEPLMHDPQIEDVSCDGVGIPVYIVHRNPTYSELRTTVVFNSKQDLDSFVVKLSQRCKRSVSFASPLFDGTLPDGSRVQATLASDIARRGSNFSIRKFTESPFTPLDLMSFKTANSKILAYLWMIVESGSSILIAGPTATGKTTMLNAISLFIRPELKIVSIEDTAELQLPHPNWIPEVARSGTGEHSYGSVEMFDLLKSALRQRPDYVIVGEVRGAEANVMFQGMATGHPAMGTLHADDVQRVVDRLVSPPINLSPAMIQNLNVIVFLVRSRIGGKYVRRVNQVVEIKDIDIKTNKIKSQLIFEWDPVGDKIKPKEPSFLLEKLKTFKGVSERSILNELNRRAALLDWMKRSGKANDYKSFAYYIQMYYANPQGVMDMLRGG